MRNVIEKNALNLTNELINHITVHNKRKYNTTGFIIGGHYCKWIQYWQHTHWLISDKQEKVYINKLWDLE